MSLIQKLVEEYGTSTSWAVRSMQNAEDLPDASFLAGQQETFLECSVWDNIKFAIREVFAHCLMISGRLVFAIIRVLSHSGSCFVCRYPERCVSFLTLLLPAWLLHLGLLKVGFRDVVFITGSYGLGEMVVQGGSKPLIVYAHKTTLNADRVLQSITQNIRPESPEIWFTRRLKKHHRSKPLCRHRRKRLLFCWVMKEMSHWRAWHGLLKRLLPEPMDIEWAKMVMMAGYTLFRHVRKQ